ncbi:hypothetical protein [Diplocloster agilis]|uniref:hypothetical protein n=1 Tax=Diplocloster agilis TaxID=2850323 RepID=UPI0008206B5E|nr:MULTISPECIES: hypothetical protein [Lachnospiraceae]MBU9747057.1 hypothetical protein [Diplocloster agilis]MCU6734961.1 hypothetical protein [Suonthocola fibrivorans]SCJ59917.1 Uncharacterised protein [uncultured Clostridium sp.]
MKNRMIMMLVLLLVLTITAPVTAYADAGGTGPLQYEVTNRNEIHINLQNLTDETMRSLDIELKLEAAAGSAGEIKFDYSNQIKSRALVYEAAYDEQTGLLHLIVSGREYLLDEGQTVLELGIITVADENQAGVNLKITPEKLNTAGNTREVQKLAAEQMPGASTVVIPSADDQKPGESPAPTASPAPTEAPQVTASPSPTPVPTVTPQTTPTVTENPKQNSTASGSNSPDQTRTVSAATTGDYNPIAIYIVIGVLAIAAIAAVIVMRRKK